MRRLVAVASVKGAPGVTTTALALAAAWPAAVDGGVRPVVVEADAAGGDVAARLGLPHAPGLLDVAVAARRPDERAVSGVGVGGGAGAAVRCAGGAGPGRGRAVP